MCDRGEDVNRVDRRLSKVIWPELKQSHSMRRKFSNFLKDLTACRSDDVDRSHLILMAEKFGVRNGQPVLVPLRNAGDDCDRTCIWMKIKREIDHLLRFLAADIGKDDRHPRKHLVTVLHCELKHRIGRCNHNVQLYPTVPAAESLCQALPITFVVELRVFDRRGIEVDLPRNTSPHGGLH